MKQDFVKLSKHCSILPYGDNDRPNIGIISGSETSIIVDGGNSESHFGLLPSAVISNAEYLFLTHNHWDHVCGSSFFYSGKVVSSVVTAEKIGRMNDMVWDADGIESAYQVNRIPEFTRNNMLCELKLNDFRPFEFRVPDITCDTEAVFDLGNLTCRYIPIMSCHCDGQMGVYVEQDKVFFIGDILWPDMDRKQDEWFYDLEKFRMMSEQILSVDAVVYVESHADPIPRNMLEMWLRKMQSIMEGVKYANKSAREAESLLPQELKQSNLGYEELLYGACDRVV